MDKEEMLGDFRIVKKIGSGPLGELYLGEHRFIRKKFALKVLPQELTEDHAFFDRFEQSVARIGALEHINLVKLHNISSDGKRYFLVTDYITDDYGTSQNLSAYLTGRSTRLSEEEVLSILKQVAYALDYIHSRKFDGRSLVHGGLKLNNILVGQSEEKSLHIYLSDYGLSSIVGEGYIFSRMIASLSESFGVDPAVSVMAEMTPPHMASKEETKIGRVHRSFLQNYAFLAPEQKIGGKRDQISERSDAYSFGVLTYFLLMGYIPEGHFLMPSRIHRNLRYDWDLALEKTLAQNPEDRENSLVALLGEVTDRMELKETEESIERVSTSAKRSPLQRREEREVPRRREERPMPKEKIKELPPKLVKPSAPEQDVSSFEQKLTGNTGNYVRVSPMNRDAELKKEVGEANVAVKDMKPKLNPSELEQHEYEEDPGAIFHEKNSVMPYRPQKKDTTDIKPLLSEMVVIEGGEYYRGSNVGARDERPRHKVRIDPFALDVHPVTNEQFLLFLEVMGGEKDANNNDIILLKESRIKRSGGRLMIESGYAKHPVVGVSWYGAIAYAKWVGKRIPTEAEWEIAASGGLEENIYPFGPEIERVQANFFSSDTTLVMSYPPNASGLYDMAGNVYEWCEDWYDYNFYEVSAQEPDRPQGPKQGVYRVLRGGCWKSLQEDLRCSHRHRNNPGTMNRTYGFRCAADVQSS